MPKPLILCILDGWGYSPESSGNAVLLGEAPNWRRILGAYPHTLLEASGEAVGLPKGQMGNSEVGHMNLGAGRVVMQLLGQIERTIQSGGFGGNEKIQEFVRRLKETGGTAHIWGLCSDGGVHSHITHIIALAQAVREAGVPLRLHAVLDGRDTDPKSGAGFLEQLAKAGLSPSTISGRYFAMDRNNNAERTERAARAVLRGEGARYKDAAAAVLDFYKRGVTDEFAEPMAAEGYEGAREGDGLLIANFRADRVRQTAAALAPHFAVRLGLAEYGEELNKSYEAIFPAVRLGNVLGEVLARHGLKQLRIAETEKYAHVTFFFNGGEEKVFEGEERILVPSPKVATYDLLPEMSAFKITDELIRVMGGFDVVILNFANGDMVGHTGVLAAAEKAVGAVDKCLGRIEAAVLSLGGAMMITADHGNCEKMIGEDGRPLTAHTTSPVECVLIGVDGVSELKRGGRLADVAPSLLKILGLPQPAEMTGTALF